MCIRDSLAGEQGHALVLCGRTGELKHAKAAEVRGLEHLRGDVLTVVRRVRRLVDHAPVLLDEANEANVLDASALRRRVWPEHPFGDRGPGRELNLVVPSGDAPGQLIGVGSPLTGDPLAGQGGQGSLQLLLVESGRQAADEERGALTVSAL